MSSDYEIETKIVDGRYIVQEVHAVHGIERTHMYTKSLDTQEEQIKQALIQLGWKAPDNE